MFLSADSAVIDELAEFMKNKRKKTPLIRKFISDNTHAIKRKSPKKITIQPQGKHYDLLEMYSSINEEYFAGKMTSEITWGASKPQEGRSKNDIGQLQQP